MPVDREEVISWVKAYIKEMLHYSINKVRQKEIAEDLVQETFLSAYQSYESYNGKKAYSKRMFK